MKESTVQLLRPRQVEELEAEKNRYQATLNAAPHIQAQIQDKPQMRKQLRNAARMLEEQAPKPYEASVLDSAVSREKELREKVLEGMPTQEEMRRNPAGAVDKHQAWENRNKANILEWKNIRLRLQKNGIYEEGRDIANFEKYRPSGGSQELLMHGEQIPGQMFHMNHIPKSVVLNNEEIKQLNDVDPELAGQLATLSAESRAAIKAILAANTEPTCDQPTNSGSLCNVRTKGGPCWQHKPKETVE